MGGCDVGRVSKWRSHSSRQRRDASTSLALVGVVMQMSQSYSSLKPTRNAPPRAPYKVERAVINFSNSIIGNAPRRPDRCCWDLGHIN